MRQLRGADDFALYVESPVQPQHTLKVLLLDPDPATGPVTLERVRAWVAATFPTVPPFRWRLASVPLHLGHPVWIDRPHLDLDYHVRHATLPEPGGRPELAGLCGELLAGSLDRSYPLWQLWHVDGLDDGRVALVLRVHHSLADGVAMVEALEAAFTPAPDGTGGGGPAPPPPPEDEPPSTVRLAAGAVRHTAPRVVRFPGLLRRSLHAVRVGNARRRAGLPGPVKPFAAPMTRFNEAFTSHRICTWAELALPTVKDVAHAFGCTLNDVYVALCASSLRAYLDARGELPAAPLTATLPVSIRTPEERGAYGNRLSGWYISLATDVADPVERLHAVHASTQGTRTSVEARDSSTLQAEWQDYAIFFKPWIALGHVAAKRAQRPSFNVIVSNVRGPAPLSLDGAPVVEIVSLGELASGLGLNFTGWSYRDRLTVGVSACPEHVPDLADLAAGLTAALDELRAAAPSAPPS